MPWSEGHSCVLIILRIAFHHCNVIVIITRTALCTSLVEVTTHHWRSLMLIAVLIDAFSFQWLACQHHVWTGWSSEDWRLWSGHCWWCRRWKSNGENCENRNLVLHGSWTSEMPLIFLYYWFKMHPMLPSCTHSVIQRIPHIKHKLTSNSVIVFPHTDWVSDVEIRSLWWLMVLHDRYKSNLNI